MFIITVNYSKTVREFMHMTLVTKVIYCLNDVNTVIFKKMYISILLKLSIASFTTRLRQLPRLVLKTYLIDKVFYSLQKFYAKESKNNL